MIRDLLRERIDWTFLIHSAFRHGIVPLLYQSLNNTCPDAIPHPVMNQLRDYFCANAQRNLYLSGELVKLLKLLEEHEIHAIPYKGPVLANAIYGNLALRQFNDLDILVHEHDVLRAKNLLLSCGYRPRNHPTKLEEAAYLRSQKDYKFLLDAGNVPIELHWRLALRRLSFLFDPKQLWERTVLVLLAGTTLRTLSPEDSILILCANGCKERWVRLQSICDMAKILSVHQPMDWEWVMKQAEKVRCRRMLFLGLFLTSDLMGVELPEKVLRVIQAEPGVKSLASQVRNWLFFGAYGPRWGVEKSKFSLTVRESLRDIVPGIPHLLSEAITPNEKDKALLPLPTFFHFVYYLLRPIRLFLKYMFYRLPIN